MLMRRTVYRDTTAVLVAGVPILVACVAWPGQEPELWTDIAAADAPQRPASELRVNPSSFRLLHLHEKVLAATLAEAPRLSADDHAPVLSLPRPDGGFERFRIWETAIQSPELQAEMERQGWPMRTYAGMSLDRPATTLSMDWGGPEGFHAAVLGPDGDDYYIDPRYRGDRGYYLSYRKADLPPRRPQARFESGVLLSGGMWTSVKETALRQSIANRPVKSGVSA